jgi:branched-chain amino acid transport system ATP-binding protein
MSGKRASSNGDARGAAVLAIKQLEVSYGSIRAVRGIDLELYNRQITVILGANGAGKSSVIRSIMGLAKISGGCIEYPSGHIISGSPPHVVNALGIAWVPEGRQVFANLTVHENLLIGAFRDWGKETIHDRLAWVTSLFPQLGERAHQIGGSLSGGEQQMLALGRALMSEPRILLLDEPSLGLAPQVTQMLFDLILTIRNQGVSVLMAEQNANQALRIADYAYLLENGELVGHGVASDMKERRDVRAAYLGG